MRLIAVALLALLAAACAESSAPTHRSVTGVSGGTPVRSVSTSRQPAEISNDVFHVVAATRLGPSEVLMIATVGCRQRVDGCAGMYRSVDDGARWALVSPPPGDLEGARIAFAALDVGVVVERNETGSGTAYSTVDGGAHWSKVPLSSVSDAAVTDQVIYLLANRHLYAAAGGGRSFAPVATISATDFSVSGGVVVAYTSIPRFTSPGDFDVVRGRSVVRRASPCARLTWSQAVIATSPGEVLAVCGSAPGAGNQLKTAFLSQDDGMTWRHVAAPDLGGYVEVGTAAAGGDFVAGGRMDPVVTSNGGRSWHTAIAGSGDAGGFGALGFSDAVRGWAVDGGPPAVLYLTDDGGRTWHAAAHPEPR